MSNDLDSSSTTQSAGEQALVRAAERVNAALDVFIELLEDVQKVISGGRPRTLKVRLGDKTLAEFPVALTAAAAFAAGIAAVLLTKLAIEVEHED
jgi:hypothetical protein